MSFIYKKNIGVIPAGRLPGPFPILRRRALLDMIKTCSPGKYLEFGCGLALLTYEFFLRGFQCTAFDIEKKAIEYAQNIFSNSLNVSTKYIETIDSGGGGGDTF
jgi:2-polyprenyl-3-methyl-5-hydroxy-6-metoxy-1,4-benzoquinol methylase